MLKLREIFGTDKPIIGMVHLPPLPGSPRYGGEPFEELLERALADARALEEGDVDGMIVENFNDYPYLTGNLPPLSLAYMAALVSHVHREASTPLGVNVLYNDWRSELALAHMVEAAFIRVEVLVDPSTSDTGLIEACAPMMLRDKADLGCRSAIFADVQGKNTYPLVSRTLVDSARDAESRGLADVLIITGAGTGQATPLDAVRQVKRVVQVPVLVGSGTTFGTLEDALSIADGAIVGSYFKVDGRVSNAVDAERVRCLMDRVTSFR